MSKLAITLPFGLMLFISSIAAGLTFKDDGSIIQKSGEVVQLSFAERFARQFTSPSNDWPIARVNGQNPRGYIGGKIFLPGTPLLSIRNIYKGEDYVDALMQKNGFTSKNALQRYMVANANSGFLKKLKLTEGQAIQFISFIDETGFQLDKNSGAVNDEFSKTSADILEKTLGKTIEEQTNKIFENEIRDRIEAEVNEALDESINEAFNDWWADYIQELVDSGATILEQTNSSVTYTYD